MSKALPRNSMGKIIKDTLPEELAGLFAEGHSLESTVLRSICLAEYIRLSARPRAGSTFLSVLTMPEDPPLMIKIIIWNRLGDKRSFALRNGLKKVKCDHKSFEADLLASCIVTVATKGPSPEF